MRAYRKCSPHFFPITIQLSDAPARRLMSMPIHPNRLPRPPPPHHALQHLCGIAALHIGQHEQYEPSGAADLTAFASMCDVARKSQNPNGRVRVKRQSLPATPGRAFLRKASNETAGRIGPHSNLSALLAPYDTVNRVQHRSEIEALTASVVDSHQKDARAYTRCLFPPATSQDLTLITATPWNRRVVLAWYPNGPRIVSPVGSHSSSVPPPYTAKPLSLYHYQRRRASEAQASEDFIERERGELYRRLPFCLSMKKEEAGGHWSVPAAQGRCPGY